MGDLMQTLGRRARSLARSPSYTMVSIGTLALCVGATAAVFGVLDAVVLEPLPYQEPDRLVQIVQVMGGEERSGMSPADLEELMARTSSFASVAWYREPLALTLTGDGAPEVVQGREVAPWLFRTLGREADLGRTFLDEEGVAGSDQVVVLTDGFWRRRFAADPGAVGRTLVLNDVPRTVVGVLPPTIRFEREGGQDVFVPRVFDPESPNHTGWSSERVIARLADGTDIESARAELDAWAAAMEEEFPNRRTEVRTLPIPLHEAMAGDVAPALWGMFAAVLVLLLVGAVNLGNLALARLTDRASDLAVLSALGASRRRIVGDQLAEAGLLATGGAALGATLAAVALPVVVGLTPTDVPGLERAAIDGRVLGFTAAVGILLTLALGSLPTLVALPRESAGVARARPGAVSRGGRGWLVGAEAGMVAALLMVSGLLFGSLRNILEVYPGFDTSAGLAVQVTLPAERYPTATEIQAFFAEVNRRVGSLPGIDRVGAAATLPLSGAAITIPAPIAEGEELAGPAVSSQPRTGWDAATPGYFDAMGIRILAGRDFNARDAEDSTRVIAVNEAFAREVFGGRDPVGRQVGFGSPPSLWMEVIAVVEDVRHGSLEEPPRVAFYQFAGDVTFAWPTMEVVVRGTDGAPPSARAVREAIQSIDPDQPLSLVRPLDAVWRDAMAPRRFQVLLLGLVSGLALALGAVGIFGVVAHATGRRRREMGIRMALGGESRRLTLSVLRDTLVVVGVGALTGVAVGMAVGTFLESTLYGVRPADPASGIGVVGALLATGALAAWIPARRAGATDPREALRG